MVITEFMDPTGVAELEESYDVLYDPTLGTDVSRLTAQLPDAKALVVRNKTSVSSDILDSAPNLALVARLGVGLDNIDLKECHNRGVEVSPAIGANAAAVAEYVIAALLSLFRGAFGLTQRVMDGAWPRPEGVGREVMGKRLGLIGLGLIARDVARRAAALGMDLAAYDPYLPEEDEAWLDIDRIEDLDDLLSSVDAVSIHVPLTEGTRNLLDARLIRSMRPGAVLINTARGGIVEEEAVAQALEEGHLGGAALDVFTNEPMDPDRGKTFADVPNLILTPHIAGITLESERRTAQMTVDAIRRVLE